ncbi:MAG TPA: ankyrin repeat domain-containing protein [Bryobacteraceae bacterium]|jgi:ankyrin repeat protein
MRLRSLRGDLTLLFLFTASAACAASADSPLADAAMRGDKEAIRTLLTDRSTVNARQTDGTTALHWAVRRDDLATAEALIAAGADVKAANRYGVTPMCLAAMNGDAAMIAVLLNAGADPNAANEGGETVLMTAARTGKVEAIKLLLDRGANVNAEDPEHAQTALMWAVIENHLDAAKLLIARGADINAHTAASMVKGEFTLARAGGGPGTTLQRARPSAGGGMTPLLFAIRNGNLEAIKLLLDSGADIHESSANRTSPLVIALVNGQTGIASYLLDRGADPNAADAYGRAALFAAVDLRNYNHARFPDVPFDGLDPLPLIKKLLEKGANPNAKADTVPYNGLYVFDGSWINFDGQTSFIRAALAGDVEVMRLLLENGADPNIATVEGTTALMAAAGMNWVSNQTYNHGEAAYLEAIKLCLAHGANINAANSLGFTALHAAAARGWESVIQLLVDNGARMDIKDVAGRTPLVFAQGVALAARPPAPQPQAAALLQKLMAMAKP